MRKAERPEPGRPGTTEPGIRVGTISFLRCPVCRSGLSPAEPPASGTITDGILKCSHCDLRFPVVSGIAILSPPEARIDVWAETTADTVARGPTVAELIDVIASGDADAALASLLLPPTPPLIPFLRRVVHKVDRAPLTGLVTRVEAVYGDVLHGRWKQHLLSVLSDPESTAVEALSAYYRSPYDPELGWYFAYRFGQPRHIATLSVVQLMIDAGGPILDFACGAGHLTHYLASVDPQRCVIGLNHNFFELLVAKRYVAPQAEFVCTDGAEVLPFLDGAFGAVLCSDALEYFERQEQVVEEMLRITTDDGVVVATRVGNVAMEPNSGYEKMPSDYLALFGPTTKVAYTEEQLVEAYLNRSGADPNDPSPQDDLDSAKWLTFAVTKASEFPSVKTLTHWPHAVGVLKRNPLYVPVDRSGTEYRLTFPSAWYAVENAAYRRYVPATAHIPQGVLDQPEKDRDAVERLIDQFVLLGMPARYL